MPQVLIGCRLPHGIIISHPNPESKLKATLAGTFSAKLFGPNGAPIASYVTTSVDQELWDAWKVAYRDFAALRNGAIFEAKSEQEAKVKAAELRKEKTGFEPLNPDSHGVKKADK